MMGAGHRAVGSAAGLALAATTHQDLWAWPVTVGLAVAASAGGLSPDMDQAGWWRRTDRLLPDEALGDGGPMQHRGISHFWGVPLAAAFLVWFFVPADTRWLAWAALTGWTSHLAGDLVFGRPGCGRGPGIPLLPWRWHIGLGLRVGGWAEAAVTAAIVPTTALVLAWTAMGAPLPHVAARLTP